MKRFDWNEGWEFRRVADERGDRADGAWRSVTLPHDAMVHERRDPRTPNSYNTGYYPGGAYEYRRRFEVSDAEVGNAAGGGASVSGASVGNGSRNVTDPWLLEFEGVYPGATVEVNGTVAAEQHYGYGGFFADVAPLLRAGTNEITVRVDNTAIPNSRWYSGAGIYRPVWLWRRCAGVADDAFDVASDGASGGAACPADCPVLRPASRVTDRPTPRSVIRPDAVRIRTIDVAADGTATIGVAVEGLPTAAAPGAMLDITVTPWRADAETVEARAASRADAHGHAAAPISVPITASGPADRELRIAVPHARLWSPDAPHLYVARITLRAAAPTGAPLDTHAERFGIRTIACDAARGFTLNGRRIVLNGGCVHHDNGILGAATWDQAEFRRARILRAAGFNAVRSAHNPLSKAFLDACDETGLLVMDEAFDMWWMHKTSHDFAARFRTEWARELGAMVRKDRNHPCMALYSIGNEIADTKSPRAAVQARRMTQTIRALDDAVPVIDCVNTISLMFAARTNAAPDEPDPRVEGEPGLNTTLEHASGPAMLTLIDRLMPLTLRTGIMGRQTRRVFAETDVAGLNYCKEGPEYFHRRHPERVFCASETYPQDIMANWPAALRLPYLIGDFVWTGWDYIGEASVSAWAYAGARDAGGWQRQFGDRLGLSGMRTAPYRRYPALLGASGLVDITGRPTAQAYYRMIVTGARRTPYVTVRPMTLLYGGPVRGHNVVQRAVDGLLNTLRLSGYDRRHGLNRTMRFIERGHDGVHSWSWHGFEGRTAVVQVFSGGARVRLELDGRAVDEQPVRRCCAEFLLPYEPGDLVAVALDRDGRELGRDAVRSAGDDARLDVRVTERLASPYGRDDDRFRAGELLYVDLAIADARGEVRSADDRAVTVTLTAAAQQAGVTLEGVASANPITPDEFATPWCTTYFGRAQAVLRVPRGAETLPADAGISVRADGLDAVTVPLAGGVCSRSE